MAQAAVEWKLIQPGRINVTGYIDKLKAALAAEVDTIDGEFHKTTATWNHQPAFEKKVDMANAMDLRGSVMTTDKIYTYITRGTRIRYATMTPGFVAKTSPGHIGSGPGRGGVLFISRKHPRPGIKARNFDIVIARRAHTRLNRSMKAAMKEASNGTWTK